MEFVPIRCRIPELLKRIGKDQQWLADQSGRSRQKISDYCNLRSIMSMATAKALANELNCSLDELYEWKRQPK